MAQHPLPVVVKADGLAAGKGVVVAATADEALDAVRSAFAGALGQAGETLVIEEFLAGEEASLFALCDGTHALEIGTAQDHKRAFDGDQGPNTGGMGAYSPAPMLDPAIGRARHARDRPPDARRHGGRGRAVQGRALLRPDADRGRGRS